MNLLDVIFPKRCVGCGKIGQYFCHPCTSIIQTIEVNEAICPVCEKPAIDGATHPRCQTRYSIDGLTSFFYYRGPIQNAIKALKYRSVSDLANEFIQCIPPMSFSVLSNLESRNSNLSLLPVPLHPSRQRERGFNQAEVLGKLIAQRLHIPMRNNILIRIKKTTPQVEMKEKDRRLKNMEGVFSLSSRFDKKMLEHQFVKTQPVGVFLFDDVFTTGATMRSVAEVLKRAGVSYVWGISMAR